MRRVAVLLLIGGLALDGCAYLSTKKTAPAPPKLEPLVVEGLSVRRGTELVVTLDQPLGKDSPPGMEYTAKVIQKVVDGKGREIIPVGAQIIGRVTRVSAGSSSEPARIDLTAEKLHVNGVDHPINATYVPTTVPVGKQTLEQNAKRGAVRGAVLGILGGPAGVVLGGLSGAAVSTGFSLGTAGRDPAVLPVGTTLTVKLDRSIPVVALRLKKAG